MGPIRIFKPNSIKPQQEKPLSLNHWKTTRKTALSQCHSLSELQLSVFVSEKSAKQFSIYTLPLKCQKYLEKMKRKKKRI